MVTTTITHKNKRVTIKTTKTLADALALRDDLDIGDTMTVTEGRTLLATCKIQAYKFKYVDSRIKPLEIETEVEELTFQGDMYEERKTSNDKR
jgi:hypothetical protein